MILNKLDNLQGQRFEFLDGLRGIASLLVALLHFHTLILEHSPTVWIPSILDSIFRNGHIGVYIFFVLSGFVIAYSVRNDTITFKFIGKFFLKRSLRLDPPYWVTLCLLSGLIFLGPLFFKKGSEHIPTLNEFVLNAFYLQNFFPVKHILPVAWTLCLEIQFYFIFVLMLKVVQDLNRRFGLNTLNYSSLPSLALFGTLYLLSLATAIEFNILPSLEGCFLPYWYSFFLGCLVCWVIVGLIKERYLLIALVCILLFGFSGVHFNMLSTFVVALGIHIVSKLELLHSLLSSSFFQYMGRISYSLYLIHWPVGIKFISLFSYILGTHLDRVPALVLMGGSMLVTVKAAEYFYRFVELPTLLLSKRINLRAPEKKQALTL